MRAKRGKVIRENSIQSQSSVDGKEEEHLCRGQKPILLSVGSVKVHSPKRDPPRQKTFNCHTRQRGSVGSQRLRTDGACVGSLLPLNAV